MQTSSRIGLPKAWARIGLVRPRSAFSSQSHPHSHSPTHPHARPAGRVLSCSPLASSPSSSTSDSRRLRREHSRTSALKSAVDECEGSYGSIRSPADIIIKKREGGTLDTAEILWFIDGFHKGFVRDYQMSAFLMAACIRGMTNRECTDMTHAMVNTGVTADLSMIQPGVPKIDKHSTGGVGDKISLILTPLAASLGLVVPMMSGRGQGHTGGTLDKLSAIPGFRTQISTVDYLNQLDKIGCAIVSPTEHYAPVDVDLFALRDVTGTIENVALVASSIMCKKLAERPDALLLDVKMGKGAFFKSLSDAASLASTMVAIGEDAGIATCCMVSSMDQPLGSAVGSLLETREAIQILGGHDTEWSELSDAESIEEVKDLTLAQVSMMLGLGGFAESYSEGYEMAREKLESGECLHKFADLVEAQGGDPSVVYDLDAIPLPDIKQEFVAPFDCIIEDIDAQQIGLASVRLGAGRHYADDEIDLRAGLILHRSMGGVVKKGQPVFTAYVGIAPALEDHEVRLSEGFELAKLAFKLVPEDSPYVLIRDKKRIEYFVDRTGVRPFEIIKDA